MGGPSFHLREFEMRLHEQNCQIAHSVGLSFAAAAATS
jgi:hypothetical protein